jgi:hypothetical protein
LIAILALVGIFAIIFFGLLIAAGLYLALAPFFPMFALIVLVIFALVVVAVVAIVALSSRNNGSN